MTSGTYTSLTRFSDAWRFSGRFWSQKNLFTVAYNRNNQPECNGPTTCCRRMSSWAFWHFHLMIPVNRFVPILPWRKCFSNIGFGERENGKDFPFRQLVFRMRSGVLYWVRPWVCQRSFETPCVGMRVHTSAGQGAWARFGFRRCSRHSGTLRELRRRFAPRVGGLCGAVDRGWPSTPCRAVQDLVRKGNLENHHGLLWKKRDSAPSLCLWVNFYIWKWCRSNSEERF